MVKTNKMYESVISPHSVSMRLNDERHSSVSTCRLVENPSTWLICRKLRKWKQPFLDRRLNNDTSVFLHRRGNGLVKKASFEMNNYGLTIKGVKIYSKNKWTIYWWTRVTNFHLVFTSIIWNYQHAYVKYSIKWGMIENDSITIKIQTLTKICR